MRYFVLFILICYVQSTFSQELFSQEYRGTNYVLAIKEDRYIIFKEEDFGKQMTPYLHGAIVYNDSLVFLTDSLFFRKDTNSWNYVNRLVYNGDYFRRRKNNLSGGINNVWRKCKCFHFFCKQQIFIKYFDTPTKPTWYE